MEQELDELSIELAKREELQYNLLETRDSMMRYETVCPRDAAYIKADDDAMKALDDWLDLWQIVMDKRLELIKLPGNRAIKYSCKVYSGRIVDFILMTYMDKSAKLVDLTYRTQCSPIYRNAKISEIREALGDKNIINGYDALKEITDIYNVCVLPECQDKVLECCVGLAVS